MSKTSERKKVHHKYAEKYVVKLPIDIPEKIGKVRQKYSFFGVDAIQVLRGCYLFTLTKNHNELYWHIEDVVLYETMVKRYFEKYKEKIQSIKARYRKIQFYAKQKSNEYAPKIALAESSIDWVLRIVGVLALGHHF